MTPDILIIGAGVHGAAAARGLAERGASVHVLEQDTAAGGPTGRSSAICRCYYTDPFLAACARDSIAELATGSLAERAGFHRTGGLYLHGPNDACRAGTTCGRMSGGWRWSAACCPVRPRTRRRCGRASRRMSGSRCWRRSRSASRACTTRHPGAAGPACTT